MFKRVTRGGWYDEDALFLATKLAIMVDGKIEQTGTTEDLIRKPKNGLVRRILTPFNGEKY